MPKPQINDRNFSSPLAWKNIKNEILNPWTPQTWTLLKSKPDLQEYSMRRTYTSELRDESRIKFPKNKSLKREKINGFEKRNAGQEEDKSFIEELSGGIE